MFKKNKEIILLISVFTVIRLVVAPHFGLGVDEAHYVLYAKYLDWSYFDHPPLVGWIHALIYYTLGTSEFLVRLPAILIFAATSYCAYLFILRISQSKHLSILSVLALNCSFMLNALGLMLLPDSLLLLFVFLLIFLAEKITRETRLVNFIYLGILLGFMGLSKYTSILLVPPLIAYFMLKKRYDIVFSKEMVLAAFIALVLITPVIIWNIQNDFISFRYQGTQVFGSFTGSIKKFLESFAAQFGAYSPFLVLAAFYGFFKALRLPDDYSRLAVLFGATIIVFFLLTSFSQRTLPHWPAIFYLLFIPLGCCTLLKEKEKWKKYYFNVAVGLSLVLLLLVYAELTGKFIKYPDYKSPFRDIYGFADITRKADEIIRKDDTISGKAIAVTNWTMGSRTIYYSMTYSNDVFVLGSRKRQFTIWEKKTPIGMDILILNTHFNKWDIEKRLICENVEMAAQMDIKLNSSKVDTVKYIWCRNYGGLNIK